VADFVSYYNTVRPHSALGYITPKDKLERRENEIFAARGRTLHEARRRAQRQRAVAAGMRARYACA
ncbi:MAG: transposase, partial [Deltaproteobacteria bacterium]|nr:transposase [Deltaproteobacteria bacterium]